MVTQTTPDIAQVRTAPKTIQDSRGYTTFRIFNGIALSVICVLTLYPFVNLIAKAFSAEAEIMAGRVNLVPRGFNTATFEGVMADPLFWINYRNTLVYTVVATAIAMVLTTMFAYALSKKFLKGRTFFIGLAVFTMFFNGGLIPNYLLVSALGFKNTI